MSIAPRAVKPLKFIKLKANKEIRMKRPFFYIFIITIFFSGCSFGVVEESGLIAGEKSGEAKKFMNNSNTNESDSDEGKKDSSDLREPLLDAVKRINKKPFGIFITPENSPVQPERFSGYHTGTDFEVFAGELETEVFVFAICSGNIESKQIIDGYGGVIVQSCIIDDEETRILYGHVSLLKEFVTVGSGVTAGEKIAILGKHESAETDEERKHLHLSIVKGDKNDLRGYVQYEDELAQWINYEQLVSNR